VRVLPWSAVAVAFLAVSAWGAENVASSLAQPLQLAVPKTLANFAATGLVKTARPSPCGDEMVLVDGMYCPKIEQRCLYYLDPRGPYQYYRCAEYAKPARCLSRERQHLRFCIDRDEFTRPGEELPANFQSYTDADRICISLGKRICRESEWNFACEGEEMRPYPYGWQRDPDACNADLTDLFDGRGKLKDLRATGASHPRCASPFGVRNLAGNLEEFVARDGTRPVSAAMKGAYWQPSRNHCRAAQTAHDRYYRGMETGFRCCSEAP
jgi:sulfatase modifying factor 1